MNWMQSVASWPRPGLGRRCLFSISGQGQRPSYQRLARRTKARDNGAGFMRPRYIQPEPANRNSGPLAATYARARSSALSATSPQPRRGAYFTGRVESDPVLPCITSTEREGQGPNSGPGLRLARGPQVQSSCKSRGSLEAAQWAGFQGNNAVIARGSSL